MRIIIPTHRRPKQQRTLEYLLSWGVSATLLGTDEEDIPDGWKDFVVTGLKGIRANRQWILDNIDDDDGKILILDDDLKFFENRIGHQLISDPSARYLLEHLDDLSENYTLTGLHPRFMINTAPSPYKENSKIYHAMLINRNLLPKHAHFRLETGEDHDFHLQILTAGFKTAVTTLYAHDDKENAPGGCSEWREDVLQDVQALADLWPEFVSIKVNGRPIIQFAKAYKSSQRS